MSRPVNKRKSNTQGVIAADEKPLLHPSVHGYPSSDSDEKPSDTTGVMTAAEIRMAQCLKNKYEGKPARKSSKSTVKLAEAQIALVNKQLEDKD